MLTSQPRPWAFVLSEGEGTISRDTVTIASGAGIVKPGTILGKITASKKYVPHAPAANDGSQTAIAVLGARVDATAADADGVAITRLAEVKGEALIYNAATDTDAEKAAVAASLAGAQIIVR